MKSFTKLTLARLLYTLGLTATAFALSSRLKGAAETPKGTDLLRARCRLREGRHHEAYEMLKEELRFHPSNTEASVLLESIGGTGNVEMSLKDREFAYIYGKIRSYTMVGPERLFALYQGAKSVCQIGLSGNFVECGVAGGGSSALLAWIIKEFSKEPRLLYSFDTFEGMPWPGKEDQHSGKNAQDTGWGAGTCAAPVESLMKIAQELDVLDVIRPVKGLFQETLPTTRQEIGAIALLHLDGDWYDSTRAILDNLYDHTREGAYMQVDDYGHWDGCRKAVDEFESELQVKFAKHVIDGTGIWFKKPGK
jgi:Macrocin-O-methyltransferase (TylF)